MTITTLNNEYKSTLIETDLCFERRNVLKMKIESDLAKNGKLVQFYMQQLPQ